jgi:hypothetical protein
MLVRQLQGALVPVRRHHRGVFVFYYVYDGAGMMIYGIYGTFWRALFLMKAGNLLVRHYVKKTFFCFFCTDQTRHTDRIQTCTKSQSDGSSCRTYHPSPSMSRPLSASSADVQTHHPHRPSHHKHQHHQQRLLLLLY